MIAQIEDAITTIEKKIDEVEKKLKFRIRRACRRSTYLAAQH